MSGVSGPLSTSYASAYHYRADGLRAAQLRATGSSQTRITAYRYDGQMPIEEAYTFGTTVEIARYAVGPRGTERQALETATSSEVSYPLYDAHGNAYASVRRDANNPGGYVPLSSADVRAFDPWGNAIVSSGIGSNTGFGMAGSGRPSQAYCGSLGHRREDETGLVYMRARYYDPQVGRFTSEDPAMQGSNWFAYCNNSPVNQIDISGKAAIIGIGIAVFWALCAMLREVWLPNTPEGRAMKNFVNATFEAVGLGMSISGALSSDEKYIVGELTTGAGIGVLVGAMVGSLIITLALRQLAFFFLLNVDPDCGLEGYTDSYTDFNPKSGRNL